MKSTGKGNAMRGRRAHTLERRRAEHEERVAAWRTLSPLQQLSVLNSRFGPGYGAVRQRARIAKQLDAQVAAAQVTA